MCVIERQAYRHPEGGQQLVEFERPCSRATTTHFCDNVVYRKVKRVSLVERKLVKGKGDDFIFTEGSDGKERVYRDVTGLTARRSAQGVRHNAINAERRASVEPLSSASSQSAYSPNEVKPAAPSPPHNGADIPTLERQRRPRFGVNEEGRSVIPGGTAIYDRPPSMDLPRAMKNERPSLAGILERESRSYRSANAPAAEDLPTPKIPQRHSEIRVKIETAPSPTNPPTAFSLGSDRLPKPRYRKEASARDVPLNRFCSERGAHAQDWVDDNTEASLEQGRDKTWSQLDRIYRCRSSRQESVESTRSHRPAAVDAFEGRRAAASREKQLEAEQTQMARERTTAASREQRSGQYDSTSGREAPFSRMPFRPAGVSRCAPYISSPQSRSSEADSTRRRGVTIHQYCYPSTSSADSIATRGVDVIAREQARNQDTRRAERAQQASQRLSQAIGERLFESRTDDIDFDWVHGEDNNEGNYDRKAFWSDVRRLKLSSDFDQNSRYF
ncbi:hypothetical protein B0A50_02208 [Salinomyces thailandicus]|uniref:Uncharacterized protein n=1 Tax=Salinomyces thailandicus TaxID=706561 RepID=A0A4U0U7X7_9PEZI|nr:hypothetical protein B0A50_02208 [Salinomyces thailandica]